MTIDISRPRDSSMLKRITLSAGWFVQSCILFARWGNGGGGQGAQLRHALPTVQLGYRLILTKVGQPKVISAPWCALY
jgi:hypothetical protein